MITSTATRGFRLASRQRLTGNVARSRQASGTTEKAQQAVSSAQQTASSAASAAQRYAQSALAMGNKVVGDVGGRATGMLGSYSAPVMSNLAIAREVAKQVYIAERLAPPTSLSELQAGFRSIAEQASSPSWWRSALESGQWKIVGIYALEAYGIFCIGEMIGRRHMVGYKLD